MDVIENKCHKREILGRKTCKAQSLKSRRKPLLAAYVVKIRIRQTCAGVWEEKKYKKCSELHHLLVRQSPPVCMVALASPSLHVLAQMNNLQEQQADNTKMLVV